MNIKPTNTEDRYQEDLARIEVRINASYKGREETSLKAVQF